ncbi:MerR family transcriptional regulator [Rhizobiaceae sp. 2RAB30]
MTDSYLLAGRFGAMTRLSPKALRLYAEQGLLVPAYVDPVTGYRYYASAQAPRARLIARLRRLNLPVARVARLVELSVEERLIELRTWLNAQEERLAAQVEFVEAATRLVETSEPGLTPAVGLRDVPSSKIAFLQSHIRLEALDDFMHKAEAEIRAHLRAAGVACERPMTVHFHDLVTRDSEGLVEVAIPYGGSIEPAGDLRLRWRSAHREAYLPAPPGSEDFPQVLRVYDALEMWLDARSELTSIDSPYEIYPGTGGARFDVAFPIAP